MIEVSECVVCGGTITQIKRALVAPFLATRIWMRDPFEVDLVECKTCGFVFYNPRLDDEELLRLYRNYRSDEYQQMRFASEPWYTPKFNIDLASAASYETRRAKLAPILRQYIGQRKVKRILDYGGDRGDLVVGLLDGAETFVYDISGIPPATGVISTADPAACQADLIVNSNVLEHIGFPRKMLREILNIAPKDGLVFIEVPCESALGWSRIARRLAQIAVVACTRPKLARHVLRPESLSMMHEHINYFTEQSITALMRSSGGSVIASGRYSSSGRAGDMDLVWCLGSPVGANGG